MVTDDNGNPVMQIDSDGYPMWTTPPSIMMRLTSSCDGPINGINTFTYTLENLCDEGRRFELLDITSVQYPNGWSGTVAANESVSIVATALETETVYVQNAQFNTSMVDGSHARKKKVARVYVPSGRATYLGVHTLQSVTPLTGTSITRASFSVNARATRVALYRVTGSESEEVQRLDGEFLPGSTYYIDDSDPLPGTHSYYVVTGIKSNYFTTPEEEWVEVTN